MKNLIWVVIALAVAVVGFVLFGQSAKDDAGETAAAPEIQAPAEVTEETVAEEAETIKEAVEEAAEALKDQAETAVETAKEDMEKAVTDAMETATDAVKDLSDSATDMADAAKDTTAPEAGETMSAADLLSPENFNMSKVAELIKGSDLDGLQQLALTKAVEAAQDNPELLKAALDQVKSALGL